MQPTAQPASSTVLGGWPWPRRERTRRTMRFVVETKSVVSFVEAL